MQGSTIEENNKTTYKAQMLRILQSKNASPIRLAGECTCSSSLLQESSELQDEARSPSFEQFGAWHDAKYHHDNHLQRHNLHHTSTSETSPFRRIQAPIPQTVKAAASSYINDPEKLKIKQIVMEVI